MRPADGWAWDYFHGNSIEPPRPGGQTLVVSARKTSAIYGVDRVTGKLRWILGGKQDEFGLSSAATFCAQHDVRRLPAGELSIFDNGGTALRGGCPRHSGRVLRLHLDTARRRAGLVRSIGSRSSADGGRALWPAAVGSARWQRNGDVLINWGNTGRITEVAPDGRVRFKLQLAHWTYRAVRAQWHGRPRGRPAVAARRAGGRIDVWASWNGHTGIRRWRVVVGPAPEALRPVDSARFADLETRIRVRSRAALVAVEALDRHGRPLGQSPPVAP